MEKVKAVNLEKYCPNFYKLGRSIGEERFRKVPVLILYLWGALPLFVMIREAIEQRSIPSKFYGIDVAMYAWYRSIWEQTFECLGKLTLAVAIVCILVKLARKGAGSIKAIRDNCWFWALLALLIWAFVCALVSGHFTEEWKGTLYRDEGLHTLLYYAAIFICTGFIYETEQIKKILVAFSMIANISAILIVLQYLNVQSVINIYPSLCASVFYNINHCGYYLNMSIIVLFSLYIYEENLFKRIVFVASITLQFFALLKNNTFGCFLAVWISMPFIYLVYAKSGRKIDRNSLVPFLLILIISIMFAKDIIENFWMMFSDVNDIAVMDEDMAKAGSGRMELWLNAVERISKRPIFGYGPEGFSFCFPNSSLADRPHCEFLQYAAFYGVPGLVLYIIALLSLIKKRWKQITELNSNILVVAGAVFAYLVSSAVGNTMFYTSPYFFMLLGFVAFADNGKKALQ